MIEKKFEAIFQIFILTCASFAFAFMLEENRVMGQLEDPVSFNLGRGGAGASGGIIPSQSAPATAVNPTATGTEHSFGFVGKSAAKGTLNPDKVSGTLTDGTKVKWNAESGAWDTVTGTGAPTPYEFKPFGFETGITGGTAHLLTGAMWAGIAYGAIQLLGNLFGFDEGLTNSLSYGAAGGLMTYHGINSLGQTGFGVIGKESFLAQNAGLIGIGVGVAIFIATYKKEKQEIVRFECLPWEAPLGGANCAKCNEDLERPCSEYRCKSLGQACEIVNKGSEEELCVWVHKEDTQSPTIEPDEDALKPQGLRYLPDSTIRPPNRGWRIISQRPDGCLPAFTKLEFGILLNEPGQCRIDYEASNEYKTEFDNMAFLFGENNLYSEMHSQRLSVPDPFSVEGDGTPEIHNDGTYTLWARCQDANGNKNEDAVAFRFCVDKGPDTFAPRIEGTSIKTNSPVRFNADRVPIEVYTDEPAECRWSKQDKDYELMENEMNCATQIYQVNADLNYVCNSNLLGIENKKENQFYFRCRDYSTDGPNVMVQSYPLVLRGTEELVITQIGPNGTITGGVNDVSVALSVKTAFGENEGNAVCYFSNDDSDDGFPMYLTGGNVHSQGDLQLAGGNYEYFIKCVDAGGNSASASTKFTLEVDRTPPEVTRVYRDADNLKIVTSEAAKCAYSLTSCDFNFAEAENTVLLYEDPVERNVHYAPWEKSKTYHIKCLDFRDNGPSPPNKCQVIARGSEF